MAYSRALGSPTPLVGLQDLLHAPVLTRDIEGRRSINLLGFSFAIVDRVTFAAAGKVIRARTHVTPQQLQGIMSWVEQGAQSMYGGGRPTEH